MTRINILGGNGYAGGAIVREALGRGHEVVVFGRNPPPEDLEGVASVTGSALQRADLERAIAGADVVVVSLAPTGDIEEHFEQVNSEIAQLTASAGARLGVVGGSGSLLVAEGGPKVYEAPDFPERFAAFARVSDLVLENLRDSDPELDWFVLSPPRMFGHYVPGIRTGRFRLGGDVMVTDAEGTSQISGADYAIAFVDEIERPTHRRERFTVAY